MSETDGRVNDLQLSKELRYCTQCQKTKPVTDSGYWVSNKARRWRCEWCAAKIKKPKKMNANYFLGARYE